uniref:ATP-dependent DNA helicase n=1 Tax=Strigamia maritima TaxID=126957 RepID=T1JDC6_STRMM
MDDDSKTTVERINAEITEIDVQIEILSSRKKALLSDKEKIIFEIEQKKGLDLANKDWNRTNFKWSTKLTNVLEKSFKIKNLRPFQLAAMNAVMAKHDCILIMPTGGGKSLTFQAPALTCNSCRLSFDFVNGRSVHGIKAVGDTCRNDKFESSEEKVTEIQKKMIDESSTMKLLYVTPEKLAKSKQFMSKLQKMYEMGRFSILAIDEVHCCSHWGHDFRPDYKFLGIMKRQFPKVPILGLTATATMEILKDVQKILAIESSLVFKAEFNRPNLKYEVCCKPSSLKESVDVIVKLINQRFHKMSGIIYCCSVKETVDVTTELQANSIRAANYHAQLDAAERSKIHHLWTSDDVQVIVATIAFGMGIDKPNVRFVIHHTISKSLENYYQESGRAGRDDNYSECILFYRFVDTARQSTMVFTEQTGLDKLYNMITYCIEAKRCRRLIIADYFGIPSQNQNCGNMCDHCCKKASDLQEVDIGQYYHNLCSILDQAELTKERLTGTMLVDAWCGKSKAKYKPQISPSHLSRPECERIVAFLITQHYFEEDFHFTPYTTISYVKKGSRTAVGAINLTFLKSSSSASKPLSAKASKSSGGKKKGELTQKTPGKKSVKQKFELKPEVKNLTKVDITHQSKSKQGVKQETEVNSTKSPSKQSVTREPGLNSTKVDTKQKSPSKQSVKRKSENVSTKTEIKKHKIETVEVE